jgi:hypothetical protein
MAKKKKTTKMVVIKRPAKKSKKKTQKKYEKEPIAKLEVKKKTKVDKTMVIHSRARKKGDKPAPLSGVKDKDGFFCAEIIHQAKENFSKLCKEARKVEVSEDDISRMVMFLHAYIRKHNAGAASKLAGVDYSKPLFWERDYPFFKEAFDWARKACAQHLEDAAFKRSVIGVAKPIYQRGELMGTEQVYSDALTKFLLQGLKPDTYKERREVEGNLNITTWAQLAEKAIEGE